MGTSFLSLQCFFCPCYLAVHLVIYDQGTNAYVDIFQDVCVQNQCMRIDDGFYRSRQYALQHYLVGWHKFY